MTSLCGVSDSGTTHRVFELLRNSTITSIEPQRLTVHDTVRDHLLLRTLTEVRDEKYMPRGEEFVRIASKLEHRPTHHRRKWIAPPSRLGDSSSPELECSAGHPPALSSRLMVDFRAQKARRHHLIGTPQ